MVKIFISQPMKGRNSEDIAKDRAVVIKQLKTEMPNAEILDTHFKHFNGNACQFLGKSIMKLGEADLAVFMPGWDEARGCRNEQRIAFDYDIPQKYIQIIGGID